MIKPEQVPDEVVEAALKKRGLMREAIADALKAWPGMDTRPNIYGRQDAMLILPLPAEVSDE